MRWVDVAGPPGVGKSTVCDPIWDHREIGWDGELPPLEWHDFINEITRLFQILAANPTAYVPELKRDLDLMMPAYRMNIRSLKKMATVARMESARPYIQTGLVQRGLGFGWRFNLLGVPLREIDHYFRLMPVSLGVAWLTASEETVLARNRERLNNPETAHENRSYQVRLMREPIAYVKELMDRIGIRWTEIDVENIPPEESRKRILEFAESGKAPPMTDADKTLYSQPMWWM